MAEKKNTSVPALDIAELKAQLKAELMAELELNDAAKEALPAQKRNPWLEEYVEIQLFKDGKDYKDDVSVHCDGENCVIKRGVPVKVKRKFALMLEESQRQDIAAAEYSARQQAEFNADAARFNI